MTIVLQYQFEDLIVKENEFSVVLSFDNQPETIVIPFASLTAFADPSVKFGLQFRHVDDNIFESDLESEVTTSNNTNIPEKKTTPQPDKITKTDGNVISLDFRNKKLIP